MAADVPVTDLVRTTVQDGLARVTIDRVEAGNSLTPEMRDHLSATFDELSATLERAGHRAHRGRSEALLHRRRPRRGAAARAAAARRRPRPGPGRRRPAHPARLAAPGGVDPRLREAGDRRRQRDGGRGRRQPRAGLRPRGDDRHGPAHRGVREARHHPRRRRVLPAPAHRRSRSGPRSSCSSATTSAPRTASGGASPTGWSPPRSSRPPSTSSPPASWPRRARRSR